VGYDAKDLEKWADECDALLLINPDNPTGNFIPKSDVEKLLEKLKAKGKKLVLDESFLDFADGENSATYITDGFLMRFPNLIVVKSLSKSYGVPGLRLGVLACGDKEVIKKVRAGIAIWNINSFAEYFLQIIGKYAKDYRASCVKIADERRRFKSLLEDTRLFSVTPSQANYFYCRLNGGVKADDLAARLLSEHNIFIKVLTGKKGIDGECVRLSIRSAGDNDAFIAAIRKLQS
jgi:histidinol-phosphate/aromatic aminotransferase/cobyric acid decarboxylase-like protein